MEQVSTRNTAPRDSLSTSLKHERRFLHFGGKATPWMNKPSAPRASHLLISFHSTVITCKPYTVALPTTNFTQFSLFSSFFPPNLVLKGGLKLSSLLRLHCLAERTNHTRVAAQAKKKNPSIILCERYSPFCFWCVTETGSREKWQQQLKSWGVIRKESRLTHRGGALLNWAHLQKAAQPSIPRCDTVSSATSAFAFNHNYNLKLKSQKRCACA